MLVSFSPARLSRILGAITKRISCNLPPNLCRVRQRRRARIRIHRGSGSDDKKGAVQLGNHTANVQQPALSARPALSKAAKNIQRPTPNAEFRRTRDEALWKTAVPAVMANSRQAWLMSLRQAGTNYVRRTSNCRRKIQCNRPSKPKVDPINTNVFHTKTFPLIPK